MSDSAIVVRQDVRRAGDSPRKADATPPIISAGGTPIAPPARAEQCSGARDEAFRCCGGWVSMS